MIMELKKIMDEIDLNLVPQPTFDTLPSVKVNGTIKLNFDNIYINDEDNNLIREHGISPAHVEDLKQSFSQGVDLNQPPPCVVKRQTTPDSPKQYELVFGYGRSFALIGLGQKGWYFTDISVDEDSIDDVRAVENEPLPKLCNSEQDLKLFLSKKINKGTLTNDETTIRRKLNQVARYRKQQSKDKIIQWVIEDCSTPMKYSFYDLAKCQLWLDNNSQNNYFIHGNLDVERNMYGHLVKEGYQYRFVVNAIRQFVKDGRHSYCLAHMGAPTNNSSIEDKRVKFMTETNSILNAFQSCGMNTNFIHVMGALPQQKGKEDWKQLIKI